MMDSNTKLVLELCIRNQAVPLLGRCVECNSPVANKAALLKNCRIKDLDYDHSAVLVFLCGTHYNDGDVSVEHLKAVVADLDLTDWKVI